MKNYLFATAFALAIVLAGCGDSALETYRTTSEYRIVNTTGADVVVKFKSGGREVTIKSGETGTILNYVSQWEPEPGVYYLDAPMYSREILFAEMMVGTETAPVQIWFSDYWKVDWRGTEKDSYITYSLTLTDELLAQVKEIAGKVHVITSYKIANPTNSNIFVSVGPDGNSYNPTTVIFSDEIKVFHVSDKLLSPDDYPERPEYVLKGNMRIGDKAVFNQIWAAKYWKLSSEKIDDPYNETYNETYTLIVTDELLDAVGSDVVTVD